MITILCLHASPGLRIFPLYPLSLLSNMVIWPGSYQDYQIKKTPFQVSLYKPKEIRLAKKSLLSGTEYGPLSASRNIFREILRISCFTVWKHTASREWTSGSCTLPGLPSKYFRPHLVNRRRFQPPAASLLVNPMPGVTFYSPSPNLPAFSAYRLNSLRFSQMGAFYVFLTFHGYGS